MTQFGIHPHHTDLHHHDICSETIDRSGRPDWRRLVRQMATIAKDQCPDLYERVDEAVILILTGQVELLPDGSARVTSPYGHSSINFSGSEPCMCPDAQNHAPYALCQHRLAVGLVRSANALINMQGEESDACAPDVHAHL